MSFTPSEIASMLGCALVNLFILACFVGIGYALYLACFVGIGYALYLAMTVHIPAW